MALEIYAHLNGTGVKVKSWDVFSLIHGWNAQLGESEIRPSLNGIGHVFKCIKFRVCSDSKTLMYGFWVESNVTVFLMSRHSWLIDFSALVSTNQVN